MLAARRKMSPCLLAFLTAAMLGRYLGVFLDADLSIVLPSTGLPKLGDLDSSGTESSGTLCSHCRAKSMGLSSRGLELSVEAVLSIDSVLASWSGLCGEASASVVSALTVPGSSGEALNTELGIVSQSARYAAGLPGPERTEQQHCFTQILQATTKHASPLWVSTDSLGFLCYTYRVLWCQDCETAAASCGPFVHRTATGLFSGKEMMEEEERVTSI